MSGDGSMDPYCQPDADGHIACPHCREAVAKTEAIAKLIDARPTQSELPTPFLEHAASTPSQYDSFTRQLAQAVLDLRAELDSVLGDWNDMVRAIGAPTHGTAIGHAKQLAARVDELLGANNREVEVRREAQREVDRLQSMLNILKRGLTKNDFELAFLDAYLDNFKTLRAERDSFKDRAEHAEAYLQDATMSGGAAYESHKELEKLRVAVARAAQNIGLERYIPGVASENPSFGELSELARTQARGWNKLVTRIMQRIEDAETLRSYSATLETENALLEKILERARGTKRCQLCGASYAKGEKHAEDCPVGEWDGATAPKAKTDL